MRTSRTLPAGEISIKRFLPLGSRVFAATRLPLGRSAVLIGPFKGEPENKIRASAADEPVNFMPLSVALMPPLGIVETFFNATTVSFWPSAK